MKRLEKVIRQEGEEWRMECSDRWARVLPDGTKVNMALYFKIDPQTNEMTGHYMELIFTSTKGEVVGPIADDVVDAVDAWAAQGLKGLGWWGQEEYEAEHGKREVAND